MKGKKYFTIMALFLIMISSFAVAFGPTYGLYREEEAEEYCYYSCEGILGDVTGNNYIDSEDADRIGEMAVGLREKDACADLSKDCEINSADKILALQAVEPYDEAKCTDSSIKGDANNDGEVTERDAATILAISTGVVDVPENICCVDVSGDGEVNAGDSTLTLQIVAGSREIEYCQGTDIVCAQVITYAMNNAGVCKRFATPCNVPNGWEVVDSCEGRITEVEDEEEITETDVETDVEGTEETIEGEETGTEAIVTRITEEELIELSPGESEMISENVKLTLVGLSSAFRCKVDDSTISRCPQSPLIAHIKVTNTRPVEGAEVEREYRLMEGETIHIFAVKIQFVKGDHEIAIFRVTETGIGPIEPTPTPVPQPPLVTVQKVVLAPGETATVNRNIKLTLIEFLRTTCNRDEEIDEDLKPLCGRGGIIAYIRVEKSPISLRPILDAEATSIGKEFYLGEGDTVSFLGTKIQFVKEDDGKGIFLVGKITDVVPPRPVPVPSSILTLKLEIGETENITTDITLTLNSIRRAEPNYIANATITNKRISDTENSTITIDFVQGATYPAFGLAIKLSDVSEESAVFTIFKRKPVIIYGTGNIKIVRPIEEDATEIVGEGIDEESNIKKVIIAPGRPKVTTFVETEEGEIVREVSVEVAPRISARIRTLWGNVDVNVERDLNTNKIYIELPTKKIEVDLNIEIDENTLYIKVPKVKKRLVVLPEEASEIAKERANFFNVRAVELETTEDDAYYQIKGRQRGKLLWLIPVEYDAEAEIDIESGEIVEKGGPWWKFLVVK